MLTFDHLLPAPSQAEFAAGWHWHLDRLTTLLQKRVRELIRGAAPLIEPRERNPIKIAFLAARFKPAQKNLRARTMEASCGLEVPVG